LKLLKQRDGSRKTEDRRIITAVFRLRSSGL